jgi:hypothetical protein
VDDFEKGCVDNNISWDEYERNGDLMTESTQKFKRYEALFSTKFGVD